MLKRVAAVVVAVVLGPGAVTAVVRAETPDLPQMIQAWSPTEPSMIELACEPTVNADQIRCGFTQVVIVRPPDRASIAKQLSELESPAFAAQLVELCLAIKQRTPEQRAKATEGLSLAERAELNAVAKGCESGSTAAVKAIAKKEIETEAQTCRLMLVPEKTEIFRRVHDNTWIAQTGVGRVCGESVVMTAWRNPGKGWSLKNVKTVPPTAPSQCVVGEQVWEFRQDTGIREFGCRYFKP